MIEFRWEGKNRTTPTPAPVRTRSLVYPKYQKPGDPIDGKVFYGDNFELLSNLVQTHSSAIDLIYIDPPFFTNRDFSARVGKKEDSRKPKDWQLASGYGDTWKGLEPYLQFLYERLSLAYQLLSPAGTLYLHLDWHADAYARLLLDEIFGSDRLLNEIIWTYHGPSPIRTAFNRKHDTILAYTKSDDYIFNVDDIRTDYNQNTIKTFSSSAKAGFGKVPDLERGKVPEDWWYFPVVARLHGERTGYPTQKPEKLLERVIKASSNPHSLILDFFCGSGTTATVASRLGRRFITSDNQLRAIHITTERLIRQGNSAFTLEEIGSLTTDIEYCNGLAQLVGDMIELTCEGEIQLWECGTISDEGVFISLDQRTQRYRETNLDKQMRVPENVEKIAVRVIDRTDRVYQQLL